MQLQLTQIQHDQIQAMRKKVTWRYPAKHPDKVVHALKMLRDGVGMNQIRSEVHISYAVVKRLQAEYMDNE